MINRLSTRLYNWQKVIPMATVSALFIKSIYFVLLWSTIKLLTIGNIIWGDDYLTLIYTPYTGFDRFAMLLNEPFFRAHYELFVWPFLLFLIFGLFGFHNSLTRIIVWYLFIVLHYGNLEISTGGHHLIKELLFFHIFLFRTNAKSGKINALLSIIHHVAFYAIWIQISLLYFVAGIWKLTGEFWVNGTALLLTLSFKEFGFPAVAERMQGNTWFLKTGTYLAWAYQLLFPVLIWVKSARKPLLIFGTIFHLSIAFLIGIADFGLFMIAAYAIFISPALAQRIDNIGLTIRAKILQLTKHVIHRKKAGSLLS